MDFRKMQIVLLLSVIVVVAGWEKKTFSLLIQLLCLLVCLHFGSAALLTYSETFYFGGIVE